MINEGSGLFSLPRLFRLLVQKSLSSKVYRCVSGTDLKLLYVLHIIGENAKSSA